MEFLKDKGNFKIIKEYLELDLSDLDKRGIKLVLKIFKSYHKSDEINELNLEIQNMTTKLSQIINTFRFKLDNKEVTSVDLSQILCTNDDRKQAYLARNQIKKPLVDSGFLQLVEMRKK